MCVHSVKLYNGIDTKYYYDIFDDTLWDCLRFYDDFMEDIHNTKPILPDVVYYGDTTGFMAYMCYTNGNDRSAKLTVIVNDDCSALMIKTATEEVRAVFTNKVRIKNILDAITECYGLNLTM